MNNKDWLATSLLAAALLGAAVDDLAAQGTTTGSISGIVLGEDGRPMAGVRIQLEPAAGGPPLVAQTSRDGRFRSHLLAPAEYRLLAEKLGYRPVVLSAIPVRSNIQVDVQVVLKAVELPVDAVDTVDFRGRGLLSGHVPGRSRYFGPWELHSLPQRTGRIQELLRFSSLGSEALDVEGLPAGLSEFTVEGLPFRPAAHGAASGGTLESLLLPTRGSGAAELLAGRPDVEWPGAAGGLISVSLPGASRRTGVDVGGYWGGEALSSDLEIPAGYRDWRAGGSVGSFLVEDSAHVWLFGEAAHTESPVRYWNQQAGDPAEFEAAGLDVTTLGAAQLGATDVVGAGGGLDWRFGGNGRLKLVALYGHAERDHLLSGYSGLQFPASLEGQDLLVAAALGGSINERLGLELRLGYGQSSRDYSHRELVETGFDGAAVIFAPGSVHVGGDPAYPANSDRSAVTGQGTAHIWSGDHHLKAGAGFELSTYQNSQTFGRDGVYLFHGAAGFADRTGVFTAAGGSLGTPSFSVAEVFGYSQGTWRIAPGLDLTTGLRYELELLPADDVSFSARWREVTGIDNRDLPSSAGSLGLVAAFDWNLRERHEWRVRGAVAMQVGDVAPELLAETLTQDGRVTVMGAVGDVTTPTTLGPRLTILAPELEPPLTTRASLGLSRALGADGSFHLDGVIRQTANLPERTDLNLHVEAPYTDQYGRPVYGRLTSVQGLIYPEPGSQRRFGEFDAVSGVSSTASSTYWGVSAALEKRFGDFKAVGSYTYSRSTDDWLSSDVYNPQRGLPPFGGVAELEEWADGISDFDVPHRFALASELTLPFAPVLTLGGFWRIESGRPFTPGFGLAIDANADGVAGNDPAFVDESIEGIAELQQEWPCLRTNAGQFVERNACRHRTRTLLDLWVGLNFPRMGAVMPKLRVEALGLDGNGWGRSDTALYVADSEGELVVDDTNGQVMVPLMVNPHFGEPTVPGREPARVRISLRIEF